MSMFDDYSLALFADCTRLTDSQIIHKWIQHWAYTMPELSEEQVKDVVRGFQIQRLPARSYWQVAGQVQDHIGVILAGLCKLEYQSDQGSVVNVHFMQEGDGIGEYQAFLGDEVCRYSLQTIEPTIIIAINLAHYEYCCQRYPIFYRYISQNLTQVLAQNIARIDSLLITDGQARYVRFIETNPKLAARLSVSDLSSYLGMSRQMLTRIRKKLGHRRA